MKIIIEPSIMARLLAYALATPNEYSGFGFCERREDGNIHVYDFVLLDVGSWGYTEIDPRKMLPILAREDRKKMKVWIHKHPLGNGMPGSHNWSGRDEQTIQREPLGATPQAVNWSVSVVLTPAGFVGRIDNYLKGITEHLEVEPSSKDFFEEVWRYESECEQPPSTPKWKRKSKRSQEEVTPEDLTQFPALETTQTKRTKITGRSSKKTRGKKTQEELEVTTFTRLSGTFSGNTIPLDIPLRTSARTTELIGPGSEDNYSDPTQDNTVS